MDKLCAGYHKFKQDVFPEMKDLFEQLAGEQHPHALFVTCADSRVLPSLITQSDPGELFICRNVGNIVPPHGERLGGVLSTIEYSVLVLGVKNIVVCGHSDCGAMRAVLHPERVNKMPTVKAWLTFAELARCVVEENYQHLPEEQRLGVLIRENVLAQIGHLETLPSVASRMRRGELQLHGWYYEIHTGAMEVYDAEAHEFVPLESRSLPAATPQPRRLRQFAEVVR
ncbi:MAG: Carbonic anhydrase 1 [Bryobacteraceae bacterium]|nr:Carbonic anhydrase 1 [Bryobacteraceae bacterium]